MRVWVLNMPKLFDFPVPTPSFTKALKINAALVNKVELVLTADLTVTSFPWKVIVGNFVTFFDNEADAKAFFDLWSARVENAK